MKLLPTDEVAKREGMKDEVIELMEVEEGRRRGEDCEGGYHMELTWRNPSLAIRMCFKELV